MGEMTDRLNAVHVHASAPGGGVHAELRGYDEIEVYFSAGFYEETTGRDLERRLEALARLLWAARERAHRDVMANLGHYTDDSALGSSEDERFHEERDQVVAEGRSDDGRISISVRGMSEWRIRLAEDTLRGLDERSFLAGLRTAVTRLVNDQYQQVTQLKVRVYE